MPLMPTISTALGALLPVRTATRSMLEARNSSDLRHRGDTRVSSGVGVIGAMVPSTSVIRPTGGWPSVSWTRWKWSGTYSLWMGLPVAARLGRRWVRLRACGGGSGGGPPSDEEEGCAQYQSHDKAHEGDLVAVGSVINPSGVDWPNHRGGNVAELHPAPGRRQSSFFQSTRRRWP